MPHCGFFFVPCFLLRESQLFGCCITPSKVGHDCSVNALEQGLSVAELLGKRKHKSPESIFRCMKCYLGFKGIDMPLDKKGSLRGSNVEPP